jgi:5'-methylthioadenosine phosphorylase
MRYCATASSTRSGALSERFDTGMTVLYDDVLDFRRTTQTFFGPSDACHVSVAPLVCLPLREQLASLARANNLVFGGTMAVIEGPRFATRAESKMYAGCGGELICQTIAPECFLVREKKMCWAGICLVSDRDTRDPSEPVSTPLIFRNMERFRDRHAANLYKIISGLRPFSCPCRLADLAVPRERTDGIGIQHTRGEGRQS